MIKLISAILLLASFAYADSRLDADGYYYGYFQNQTNEYIVVKILQAVEDGSKEGGLQTVWGPERIPPESYTTLKLPAGDYFVAVEDHQDFVTHIIDQRLDPVELAKHDGPFIWVYSKDKK